MVQAKQGDTVRVHYVCHDEDGVVVDTSYAREEPMEFTIGEGQVIPGFEEAVIGMGPGESLTVEVPMERAYGPRRPELVMDVPRSNVPPDLDPEVGQILQVRLTTGQVMLVVITNVTDELVTLDANHPLAGKNLTFDIELVEIVS